MLCYKCHNQMKKEIYKNTVIDFCQNCGSIWLNKNQLENILFNTSKLTKNTLLQLIKKEIKKEQRKILYINLCPQCSNNTIINKRIFNIPIDYCVFCKGMFFDYKQLEKIIKTFNNKSFLAKIFYKIKFKLNKSLYYKFQLFN